jgi:hypothetical protein
LTSSTKNITKTKKIAEDVFDSTKTRRAPALARAAGNSCMPKTIVTLPLISIGKHAVRFSCFFEFFFRAGVVRIFVGVIPDSQPAVSALYFLITSGASHTKHFIIISFTHFRIRSLL